MNTHINPVYQINIKSFKLRNSAFGTQKSTIFTRTLKNADVLETNMPNLSLFPEVLQKVKCKDSFKRSEITYFRVEDELRLERGLNIFLIFASI